MFFVLENPYLDTKYGYSLKNSKYTEKLHVFGLRSSQKAKCWPKFGTYDGLSALKHALSCFSSSKTPMYIPNMPIF